MPRKYTPQEQIQVFWSGIAITSNDDKCWLWQRHLDHSGYGKALYGNRQHATHRIMWMLTYGDIPKYLEVCHTCDVRNCCNPKHLFLGSHLDNMRDMVSKNRQPNNKHENNPHHKLTLEQVTEIRTRYSREKKNGKILAREYGIGQTQLYRIVHNEHWKDA